MRKIQLDKEYKVKINNNVLEKFEDESGVNAFQFDQRNFKQLKVMVGLAIEEAEGKVDKKVVHDYLNLGVAVPLIEEYMIAVLGPDAAKELDPEDSEKK